MTTKTQKTAKSAKPAKSSKNGTKAPKGPTIFKNVKMWHGGVRLDAQKILGSKGATIATVQARMKVPERKAAGYLNWLAAAGYVKRMHV